MATDLTSPPPPPLLSVALTDAPIDTAAIHQEIADPQCGAQLVFCGCTRGETRLGEATRNTTRLLYDAYRPLAEAELRRLLSEAVARWPLRRASAVHRLGEVPVGESSIVIGLASPHRGAVMEAMPWLMDQLKKRVPIWKQECFADGATEWVHPQ